MTKGPIKPPLLQPTGRIVPTTKKEPIVVVSKRLREVYLKRGKKNDS